MALRTTARNSSLQNPCGEVHRVTFLAPQGSPLTIDPILVAASLLLAMFVSMMLFMEIGRRIGVAGFAREPDGQPKGIGSSEGAIFGLLGLVLAFAFSGAVGRFEDRRHLITEEANNIGTAWLRIDLLPVVKWSAASCS